MDTQERIVREVRKMTLAERKEIALRILSEVEKEVGTLDATVRFRRLVPFAESALGVSYSPLPMSRRREDVMVRWFVAKQMAEEGYTRADIGRAMLRNHSSVTLMIRSVEAIQDGYLGKTALRQYNDFKQRLQYD